MSAEQLAADNATRAHSLEKRVAALEQHQKHIDEALSVLLAANEQLSKTLRKVL